MTMQKIEDALCENKYKGRANWYFYSGSYTDCHSCFLSQSPELMILSVDKASAAARS